MSNKTRTLRIFGMILLVITQLILISYMASGSPASSLTYIDLEIVVLNEVNAAPTDITLTGNIVEMVNSANGTVVGTLHTTDPNADDSHDYMLIDNAEGRFHVVDDEVIVNDSTKLSVGTYSITVRSTDLLGEYYDKVFLITVQDAVLEVTTWGAGNISSVGALLIGHVNPKNISTTVTFEYGTDTSYGTVVTADQSPVSGSVISEVSAEITGLMPGTTYHFRVNGVNAGGSASGMDKTFTTLQLTAAPTATVTTNNGTKKKDAVITVSSERDALIIYTTALNGEIPATPTISTPTCVMEGRAITYPALANGDVLNIKAVAIAPGKAESNVTSLSYTVQPTTELQLSGIVLYDKEYDGNTDAPADFSGAGLTGVIGPDSVALSGTPSASYLTPEVESDKTVTVSGYSLSGIDSEYYTLNTTLAETSTITKKALTLGAIIIEDKTYDGENAAVISSIPINSGIAGSEDVSDSVYGYHAMGLTNGTQYAFTVNALGHDRVITHSAQATSVPRTVPGAPTNVRATVGDSKAIIRFNSPADNGGSEIIGFAVTTHPGGMTTYGMNSPITMYGLTNGTSYAFTVRAINAVGESEESGPSNAVTPRRPADESDDDPTPTPTPTPTPPSSEEETQVDVLVNGKIETAATSTSVILDDKTVTTVTVDDQKIEEKLKQEGIRSTVTIPFANGTDVAIGKLNGQTVKNMEMMDAVLEIRTGNATYAIPASEINIDAVSEELGSPPELKDIKIRVSIAAPTADTVSIVEDSANKNAYQLVVKPIEFEITCNSGDKTVSVSKFNSFVERTIAIPDDIDPGKITTAIVLNPDGTFSHVPTTIIMIDGRYYAKINSLTNSTYSVIYNPVFFHDVDDHWAKEDINEMGSRLIMHGYPDGSFDPDSAIARDEFAAVVVRALGLMRPGTGRDVFFDVTKEASHYDAVSIAHEYGIISGYGNNLFGSMDKITREQAITMIAKAMKLTGLKAGMTQIEQEKILEWFADSQQSAEWAKESLAAGIKTEIVYGKSERTLAPKDEMTRAEAAALVRRFLQKSGLI